MRGFTRRQFLSSAAGLAFVSSGFATPAAALVIHPRSAWGSSHPPVGPLDNEDVRFLLVHHSASHNGHTGAEVPGILRGWFDFHTTSRGWNDIAYNFVVDAEGGVWEARQGSIAGAIAGDATGGNQGFSQLVCLIGDFNAAQPTAASLASLRSVLAWLADKHVVATSAGSQATFASRGSNQWPAGTSVTTPTINGHRSMSQTSCPGDNLYSYVAGDLMADVQVVRSGGALPPPSSTSSTVETVAPTSEGVSSTSLETTTSLSLTTTEGGLLPTSRPGAHAGSGTRSLVAQADPDPILTATSPSTTTTQTVVVAGPPGPPTDSPLLLGAAVVAGVATALVLWRSRRMGS